MTPVAVKQIRAMAKRGMTDREIGLEIGLKIFQVQKIRDLAEIPAGQQQPHCQQGEFKPESETAAAHWKRHRVRFEDHPRAARPDGFMRSRGGIGAQSCASSLVGLEGA
jgi:hypothetical protein